MATSRSIAAYAATAAALGAVRGRHLTGPIGESGEVAQAVVFPADAARASFITGSTLTVDGGALCRLGTE